jgi:hypothetical protein
MSIGKCVTTGCSLTRSTNRSRRAACAARVAPLLERASAPSRPGRHALREQRAGVASSEREVWRDAQGADAHERELLDEQVVGVAIPPALALLE